MLTFKNLNLCAVVTMAVILSLQAVRPPVLAQQKPELTDVPAAPNVVVDESPQELMQAFPQLAGLEPATSQEELPNILIKVGESVEAFFHNFVSTSADEEVVQQRLKRNGKVAESLKQKFQYLLVAPKGNQNLELEEYRTDKKGIHVRPRVLADAAFTSGFASMPLHFHPKLQAQSRFSYVGRQKFEGHDTYVVAFAQKPEVARFLIKLFLIGGTRVVFLEGLAWIDTTSFQIIHMSTKLLPGTDIETLNDQTTDVTLMEVHFEGVPEAFWLPKEVVVSTDWTDNRLRNIHRYSNYRLYASQTKIISDSAQP